MISNFKFIWLVYGWFAVGFSGVMLILMDRSLLWGVLAAGAMAFITVDCIKEAALNRPDDLDYFEDRYKAGLLTPTEVRAHETRKKGL